MPCRESDLLDALRRLVTEPDSPDALEQAKRLIEDVDEEIGYVRQKRDPYGDDVDPHF